MARHAVFAPRENGDLARARGTAGSRPTRTEQGLAQAAPKSSPGQTDTTGTVPAGASEAQMPPVSAKTQRRAKPPLRNALTEKITDRGIGSRSVENRGVRVAVSPGKTTMTFPDEEIVAASISKPNVRPSQSFGKDSKGREEWLGRLNEQIAQATSDIIRRVLIKLRDAELASPGSAYWGKNVSGSPIAAFANVLTPADAQAIFEGVAKSGRGAKHLARISVWSVELLTGSSLVRHVGEYAIRKIVTDKFIRYALKVLYNSLSSEINNQLQSWLMAKYGREASGRASDRKVLEVVAEVISGVVSGLVKFPFSERIKDAKAFRMFVLELSKQVTAEIAKWMTRRIVQGPATDPYRALPNPELSDLARIGGSIATSVLSEMARRHGISLETELENVAQEYLPLE